MTVSSHVVLLGASSDIGGALLAQLSKDPDAHVLAVSRRPISQSVCPPSVKCLSGIDLAQEASLERLARAVSEEFSDAFSVVHCVGNFWIHQPLVETSFSEIAGMFSSHVLTLFGAARFLTPHMIARGGGRLVAFSCNSVAYSYPDMSPFTASKAAVESFVRCYANEYAEFGITSCALALPTIRTAAVLQEKPGGDHENYITPDDLAETIVSTVLAHSDIVNGNVIKLFKHSPTFYHSSYYDRNPRRPNSTLQLTRPSHPLGSRS